MIRRGPAPARWNAVTIRTGPRNLISDVAGIRVGNAGDTGLLTGVTVVLPDTPVVAAVDVRGGGPGTRETDALDPSCMVDVVHAIVLSGGSAYGLDAAGAVTTWLAERGVGFPVVGETVVPIVPSAILFDLINGGHKRWGAVPPYRDLAVKAAEAASAEFALGNAGAGIGAKAGTLKGGLGSASFVYEDEAGGSFTVGALAAVNSFGSTVVPGASTFWAWQLEQDGELGGQVPPSRGLTTAEIDVSFDRPVGSNTTLAVVATDAELTKAQAGRIAIMAHDGLARAIRPVHTPFDGDSVFVLSTGRRPLVNPVADVARIGVLAADCVARAVARGVYEADSLGPFPGYRSVHGSSLKREKEMGGALR